MFCPNCGNNCGDARFCSECGCKIASDSRNVSEQYPPLKEPYMCNINGKDIDLNKIIVTYGNGIRKSGAYYFLAQECGITSAEAKAILEPVYLAHEGEKISFANSFSAEVNMRGAKEAQAKKEKRELKASLEESGQVYCPKCLSTSVSANKKGFGIGKAVVGAAAFGGIGLAAGNLGAKKVICTCLKCGHQWSAGKK